MGETASSGPLRGAIVPLAPISAPVLADGGLNTNVRAPRLAGRTIHRAALLQQLDAGRSGTLSLVLAPPGSGKTTLLLQWSLTLRSSAVGTACPRADERSNAPGARHRIRPSPG
jgi:LuxR family maltose regulon positive regulatory protein